MEQFFSYILDVLGEFRGGRGSPENDYVRFGLAAIMFAVLLYWALRNRSGKRAQREALLVLGFSLGLGRELFKFVIKSLQLQGLYEPASLELFFPPIDHALLASARVAIGAAFLLYLLESRKLAYSYLLYGMLAVAAF